MKAKWITVMILCKFKYAREMHEKELIVADVGAYCV